MNIKRSMISGPTKSRTENQPIARFFGLGSEKIREANYITVGCGYNRWPLFLGLELKFN